jgi:hypothetical protein
MDGSPASSRDTLLPVTSLEEFFRESIDAALAANRVVVDGETSHYVVRLLTLFARADACYQGVEGGSRHRPLALILADAAQAASREERSCILQQLGDVSLFTAGFFADSLHGRTVGLDYYCNMGGGAYRLLAAGSSTLRGRALAQVFAELAAKFLDLVDVLNEVRECARCSADQDVLRLYDTWLRTGSRRAGRLLREAGIEPVQSSRPALAH